MLTNSSENKMQATFQIKGQTPATFNHSIIKVGRDPRSHLIIDDVDVSRMHAVIEVSEEDLTLIDLGNEPGTKVNGARVNRCKIKKGDVLLFGQTEVVFLGSGNIPEKEIKRNRLLDELMNSTGCSEQQAKEMLDRLAEKADNDRWIYCDGKVEHIRLIGNKIEMPDGSRHLPQDMGGFEELEQFKSEWDALEYGLEHEQKKLEQAEERVRILQKELRSKPSTYGWREQS
jgi:hypothetical protein